MPFYWCLVEGTFYLDKFSQKMLNSGHTVNTVRSILVSGIKGYKRRVARSVEQNTPLHSNAGQSAAARRTKKLLAKLVGSDRRQETQMMERMAKRE